MVGFADRRCPACGAVLRERQRACSPKCRAALSRQRRAESLQERDHQVRRLLEAALGLLRDGQEQEEDGAMVIIRTEWREEVKDPQEARLFEALEDERWDWRTLGGLQRSCGMNETEVRQTVAKYPTLMRESRSSTGEPIFTLQRRYLERKGFLTKLLDFMSHQSTSTAI